MATEDQLVAGLKAAAAAGNEQDARAFAQALQTLRTQNSGSSGATLVAPRAPSATPASAPPSKDVSWSQVPSMALSNLAPSAMKTVEAVVTPFMHPVDTAKSIYHTAAGYAEKFGRATLYPGFDGPDEKYADALNNYVANRYGSEDAIKKTIATDPLGAATDLATFVGGGAGLAAKAPGVIGKAAEVVGDVAKAVNPINAAAKGAAAIARPVIDMAATIVKPVAEAPSIEALRTAARAAYDQALNAGVTVRKTAFNDMVSGLSDDLEKKGIDPALHPRATAVLNRLKDQTAAVGNLSLQDLDTLRKVAGHAANSTDASERMMAGVIQDHIDDFVDNLDPDQVLMNGADVNQAVSALNNARALWAKASKGDILQAALDRAANRPDTQTMATALRTQFRQIANNQRKMARFSAAEQAAIKAVANGGPMGKVLRPLAWFAPLKNLTGIGRSGMASAAGMALGGLPGAFAAPAIAQAADLLGQGLTRRQAALASALVRGGDVSTGIDWTKAPNLGLLAPYTAPAYQFGQIKNQQQQPLSLGFSPSQ